MDEYSAAMRDASARARLQAAFAALGGEGEAVDELWWRERPGVAHPGGLRDPGLERVALVEAAYSKATSDQDARQAAAALRAFESHRRRQTDALDGALATAMARPPRHPVDSGASSGSGSRAALPTDDEVRTGPGTPPPAEAEPTLTSFARRHRTLLAVAALVGAAAVGALAVTAQRSLAPTPPTSSPAVEASAAPSVLSGALARVQVPTDALPGPLRTTVDPRSSRLLYDDDPEGGDTKERWRLWTGTGENPAQLCFVATFDNVRSSVTCLPRTSALADRIIVTDTTSDGTFVALVDGGAVAVEIS